MKAKLYLLLYLIFLIVGIIQIIGGLSLLIGSHNWNIRIVGAIVGVIGVFLIHFGVIVKKNGKK